MMEESVDLPASPPEIVVDASAIIALIAREPEAEFIATVLLAHRLIAPATIDFEIGNALSKALKRKTATLEACLSAVAAFERLQIRRVGYDVSDALTIAALYNLYIYDALMLQCASRERCALLTLDQPLFRAALQMGVGVVEVIR